MTLFALPSWRRLASGFHKVRERFFAHAPRGTTEATRRRLVIDPLEQRTLLSVTAGLLDDLLVNQVVNESVQATSSVLFRDTDYSMTTTAQAVAADNDGDFVVAWTRYDPMLDVNGDPVFDAFGNPLTDANIYARYFTDETQQIVLPDQLLDDDLPGSSGKFSLVANGPEVQKLTITATYEPFVLLQENMADDPLTPQHNEFVLQFDQNGSGSIEPGEQVTILYDELRPIQEFAEDLEVALQGIGGALVDVQVQPINPHEFLIEFGDASRDVNGVPLDQPEIMVDPASVSFETGFYPSVMVETVREPLAIDNIPVVPGNPSQTAANIVEAFETLSRSEFAWAPIDFPPPNRVSGALGPRFEPNPITGTDLIVPQPSITRFRPAIEIDVVPVLGVPGHEDGTVFNVTFTGISGAQDHPEMVVTAMQDEWSNPVAITEASVRTLKEPSPEFRVNPEEPDDPNTFGTDKLDQTNAVVAMDADGEFVIAWESEVSNAQNFGSVSDVFARRFTPAGLVDPADVTYFSDHDLDGVAETPVQGVRGLVSPHARVVQLLTFDLAVAAPVQGTFQLSFDSPTPEGTLTTEDILFDTGNLLQTAADIQQELELLGLANVSVTQLTTADPYQFRVEYDATFGTNMTPDEFLPHVRLDAHEDPALAAQLDGGQIVVADGPMDLLTFRVNQFTTNAQGQPSIGMDDAGNFVIAWAGNGQDISYFNGVVAQRFNRHGVRQGSEFLVNTEDTDIHFDPYVAMSPDGHFLVTWSETSDPGFITPDAFNVSVNAEVYDAAGTVIVPQFTVGGGGASAAAFAADNRFVISWDALFDADNIGGNSEGVHAVLYDIGGNELQSEFRANSSSLDPAADLLWPLNQSDSTPAFDADGDLIVQYDGFGPDVSENIWIAGQLFQRLINTTENADLIAFFDPTLQDLPDALLTHFAQFIGFEGQNFATFLASNGDVDGVIDEILFSAVGNGATDEQVGRLRAILDRVAGLMRGEANGVMFSRYDADPTIGSFSELFSDSIANAHRDGHNHREIISLDETVSGGSFTLRIGGEDVTVNVVTFPNSTIVDTAATAVNIDNALEAAARTGVNWPETSLFSQGGPIDVRVIAEGPFFPSAEVLARQGTPWELDPFDFFFTSADPTDYIFEVTFQGETHDTPMILSLAPGGNNLTTPAVAEVQTLNFSVVSDGWFALTVGGQTTGDILFNSANPTAVAGSIQTELDALFPGTTVQYVPGTTDPFQFTVTFGGASAGQNVPGIQGAAAQDHAAPDDPIFQGNIFSTEDIQGGTPDAVPPDIVTHTYGDPGEAQFLSSLSMEPDGDFISAWTHAEQYTDGTVSNNNIYVRRFNETTDTAGPEVGDLVDHEGNLVDPGGTVLGPVNHVVLTFDEDMMRDGLDSVTNPQNYELLFGNSVLDGGVVHVEYGMNKAAELVRAGALDPITGQPYNLDPIPSNKWEAVLTLDGNGDLPGTPDLRPGTYTIRAIAATSTTPGLRDRSGNPLGRNGFTVGPTNPQGGVDFSRPFVVVVDTGGGNGETPISDVNNGRLFPESPGAVAVDADGDHIVVWTAYDQQLQRDRVFFRIFDADGTPADLDLNDNGVIDDLPGYSEIDNAPVLPVTPAVTFPELDDVDQRHPTVDVDLDGDFVITWTQYDQDGTGSNIWARRFRADLDRFDIEGNVPPEPGLPFGDDPFRVNTYTSNNQKWSDVALDADGDFVVVWSSFSQTDGNQLGTGYDLYARRFTSYGTAVGPEFLATVTTGGNEMYPSVAMDAYGGFVIAWVSDQTPLPPSPSQTGSGTDIIVRGFWSDGTPQGAELIGTQPGATVFGFGEVLVNQTTDGNQTYPDVDMNMNGTSFVVTWTSDNQAGDPGQGIVARQFSRNTNEYPGQAIRQQFRDEIPLGAFIPDPPFALTRTITVPTALTIEDLDVSIDIDHPRVSDLRIFLTSPAGTTVVLSDRNPQDANGQPLMETDQFVIDNNIGLANFDSTIFDDDGAVAITDAPPYPSYANMRVVPEEQLSQFNGLSAAGTWTLTIQDREGQLMVLNPEAEPDQWQFAPSTGFLNEWTLEILPTAGSASVAGGPEFGVNETTVGDQFASSVAMNDAGDFVVAWSGIGQQGLQADPSGYGVFFQRFDATGTPLAAGGTQLAPSAREETRVNQRTDGNQWIPSVDMDGSGNFVVAWMGPDPLGSTNAVYKSLSNNWFVPLNTDGPVATELQTADGHTILDGGVVTTAAGPIGQLRVVFSEDLSVEDGTAGLDSVLNPNNWTLQRNGQSLLAGIVDVDFFDPTQTATRKYEALVTVDGDSLANGLQPLPEGYYTLVVRSPINDVAGNALDGDVNGSPGTDPVVPNPGTGDPPTGYDGAIFRFAVAPPANYGAEFRVNADGSPVTQQRFGEGFGTGLGMEETSRTMDVDNDGDFVVVWTSYGPDGKGDVYMRLFNNDGPIPTARTPDIRVHERVEGNQRNPSVAMDADGDFIVTWEEVVEDGDGNVIASDVYARRFDAMGNPLVSDVNHNHWIDAGDHDREFIVSVTEEGVTTGIQYNPAVAVDDYGNAVVVWASSAGQPFSYFNNIFARRYNLKGEAEGNEFRVNEEDLPAVSQLPGSQELNPAVGMDPTNGNFTVAWEVITDQRNGVPIETRIHARMFNPNGTPKLDTDPFVEGDPFGPGNLLATNPGGEWQASPDDEAAFVDPTHDPLEAPGGGNFINRQARNPQVAYDTQGHFTIVWEAFQDNDLDNAPGAESYGVYFVRFDRFGVPSGVDDPTATADLSEVSHQANLVITSLLDPAQHDPNRNTQQFGFAQVNPSIAMDADGDYVIVWNGNGADPDPINPAERAVANADREGVFVRWFHAPDDPSFAQPEFVTPQRRVNLTSQGIQHFPTVAMTPDGDVIVVWNGTGVGDQSGIFGRRYDEPTDTAGPLATELRLANASRDVVADGDDIYSRPTQLVVVFDEEMRNVGAWDEHSVTNPNNWALTLADGTEAQGAITSITFNAPSPATFNKWEAVLTFDGPLPNGTYTLTARSDLYDAAGNPLARTGFRPEGTGLEPDGSNPVNPPTSPTGGMSFRFRVRDLTPGDPLDFGDTDTRVNDSANLLPEDYAAGLRLEAGEQSEPAVARVRAADSPLYGMSVVVWSTDRLVPVDPNDPAAGQVLDKDIMAQRYDAFGEAIGEPIHVGETTLANALTEGTQAEPDVAIDGQGNFVVVWSGMGGVLGTEQGIFGQRFDADGEAVGGQFRVNQYRDTIQDEPSVAMAPDGDFVVSWTSYRQDGDADGVFARRYNFSTGQPQGDEFQVNTTWRHWQRDSEVAIDDAGNFVIVWESDGSDDSSWGIYGQRFAADGTPQGGEFRANTHTADKQIDPAVAMDQDGDFVVAWSSFGQDGSGYGIYARRYNAAGVAQGGEVRVNETTANWQMTPAVAMDVAGNYVVTWSSFGQDYRLQSDPGRLFNDFGVYARLFQADGQDQLVGGVPLGEFRINAEVEGDQVLPDVAMGAAGDLMAVWVSPDPPAPPPADPNAPQPEATLNGVYTRVMGESLGAPAPASTELVLTGTPGDDVIQIAASETPGDWTVLLNGAPQAMGPDVLNVRVDGGGGNDFFLFTGCDADETVEFWGDGGTITSGAITVRLSNFGQIRAEGAGGNDTARLHDGEGNDLFGAWSGGALMSGPGVDLLVRGFENTHGYSSQGYDVARLYDSRQDDLLVANFDFALLTGGGLSAEARGFDEVHTYAVNGGFDTAKLYDSAGNDIFHASPTESSMWGLGAYNRAKGFEAVHAFGGVGLDVAHLSGSAGDDTFHASPVEASMAGTGYYVRAKSFEEVDGNAGPGYDEAFLFGSDGNDLFAANPTLAVLSGPGYSNQARGFDRVVADASGTGVDEAKLFDSPGDDTFAANPITAILSGTGYQNEAVGFNGVHAYSTSGFDTAKLYDSAGDDKLVATPTEAYLYNNSGLVQFFNRAKYFDATHAYANGGMDEADLYGLSSKDTFRGDAVDAALYSLGSYYNRAKDFEKVRVHGNVAGGDSAELTGATVDTGFTQRNIEGAGATFSRVVWLFDFAECKTRATSSDPLAPHPVDAVLSAYWS